MTRWTTKTRTTTRTRTSGRSTSPIRRVSLKRVLNSWGGAFVSQQQSLKQGIICKLMCTIALLYASVTKSKQTNLPNFVH
jgi:hypothetical protein